jgi:hypothetical protein
VPTGKLTLAEASSYVTGAVEYLEVAGREWKPFDPSVPVAPTIALGWQFRLRRPKRSRVQEMALDFDNNRINAETTADVMAQAVRAVCEYLRRPECQVPGTGDAVAGDVEREFLETR